jgi:hypothetical protein
MNPIHGQQGKYYYAIHCANADCKQLLYVMETPPFAASNKSSLQGETVRCPMCTRNTVIEERRLVFIEVR